MAECCDLQKPLTKEICGLKEAIAELEQNTGHPPLEVTFGPAANSFDEEVQLLHVQTYNIPTIPDPEVVTTADDAGRVGLAPTKTNSLLIQTSDVTNSNRSIWAATGTSPGNWVLKVGSLGAQNASAVAITGGTITGITDLAVLDGGTGASSAAGARVNLAIATQTPVGSAINWNLGSSWFEEISANTVYTFSNEADDLAIMVMVASTGAYTVTWPAGILWPGGTPHVHSGSGFTDAYAFVRNGGITYASVVAGYTTP